MFVGILIGLGIAVVIAIIAGGVSEASKLMLYNGERFKLVAGQPNGCRHDLEAGQSLNGCEFRPCHWCSNVYVNVNDLLKVHYDNEQA